MRRRVVRAVLGGVALGLAVLLVVAYRAADRRHMWTWLPSYAVQVMRGAPAAPAGPVHVLVLFTDHFEPKVYEADPALQRERMARWTTEYPTLADPHRDAYGRVPQHTFFYPADQVEGWTLESLGQLAFAGYGEVEMHLHHSGDTEETLRATLEAAKDRFGKYGALLTYEPTPQARYGFIHGLWTLDNSDPDADYCGVNRELDVLRETGCYADFTFPAPHNAEQPRMINAIYYAVDTPAPKSYDTGVRARVGVAPPKNSLLLIEGVIGLRGKWGPFRLGPGTEISGNFYARTPPTPARADYWVRTGVHVAGRPEWVFLKLTCHGADESTMVSFFDGPFDRLFTYLETAYNDGERYVLHYVTAREAYNIVKAAEAGLAGDPNDYRDYEIPPYANGFIASSAPYTLETGGKELRLRVDDPADVRLAFRRRTVRSVVGPIAALAESPEGGQVRAAMSGAEVRIVSTRPIATVDGGALAPRDGAGGEWTYLLTLGADSRVARWSYE